MIAKKIIKTVFIVFLVVFNIFIFARIFLLTDKSALSDIFPTDNAISAYAEKEKKAFVTHKVNDEIARDGYFSAAALIYDEKNGELQLTGRYNNSLFSYMDADPETEFSWKIVDEDTGNTYEGKVVAEDEKYLYHYRKIVFENVFFTDTTHLKLYLCYEDKYPLPETVGLLVHYPNQEFKAYKLNKTEKEALAG